MIIRECKKCFRIMFLNEEGLCMECSVPISLIEGLKNDEKD